MARVVELVSLACIRSAHHDMASSVQSLLQKVTANSSVSMQQASVVCCSGICMSSTLTTDFAIGVSKRLECKGGVVWTSMTSEERTDEAQEEGAATSRCGNFNRTPDLLSVFLVGVYCLSKCETCSESTSTAQHCPYPEESQSGAERQALLHDNLQTASKRRPSLPKLTGGGTPPRTETLPMRTWV